MHLLQEGYRTVRLKNKSGEIVKGRLLVHIQTENVNEIHEKTPNKKTSTDKFKIFKNVQRIGRNLSKNRGEK